MGANQEPMSRLIDGIESAGVVVAESAGVLPARVAAGSTANMDGVEQQEHTWETTILVIWGPGKGPGNRKYRNGSLEYRYFHNVFKYLDAGLLNRFEKEVKRANNNNTGYLNWTNVWGTGFSVSYIDSIEKVFALLYERRSTDPSGVDQWIQSTEQIVDYRKKGIDWHSQPDAGHKKIYKWWVCFYALLQILHKFGNSAVTRNNISNEARQELKNYHYYDINNGKMVVTCTTQDIAPFQRRL